MTETDYSFTESALKILTEDLEKRCKEQLFFSRFLPKDDEYKPPRKLKTFWNELKRRLENIIFAARGGDVISPYGFEEIEWSTKKIAYKTEEKNGVTVKIPYFEKLT